MGVVAVYIAKGLMKFVRRLMRSGGASAESQGPTRVPRRLLTPGDGWYPRWSGTIGYHLNPWHSLKSVMGNEREL